MLLDFERDGVEVLFLLKQYGCAIIIPEVAEMGFDLELELRRDVFSTSIRLVLDLANEGKPSLQRVFVVAEAVSFDRLDNFDETIHQY